MAYLLTVAQKINIDLSALWLCKKSLEEKTTEPWSLNCTVSR